MVHARGLSEPGDGDGRIGNLPARYGSFSPVDASSTAYRSARDHRTLKACEASAMRAGVCVPMIGIGRAG